MNEGHNICAMQSNEGRRKGNVRQGTSIANSGMNDLSQR